MACILAKHTVGPHGSAPRPPREAGARQSSRIAVSQARLPVEGGGGTG